MIKAMGTFDGHPLCVLGLSDGNVQRLKDGQPILTDLEPLGSPAFKGRIAILYGQSEQAIADQMHGAGLIRDQTKIIGDPKLEAIDAIPRTKDKLLICTVGLPRSGKTTWAKSQAYPIVCPDAIRLALHGQRYIQQAEGFVWAIAKTMVRALFQAGHNTVVLDATNNTRKRRDEWQSKEWDTVFKVIYTSAAECMDRASAESDEEIIPIISRMAGEQQSLGEGEIEWP